MTDIDKFLFDMMDDEIKEFYKKQFFDINALKGSLVLCKSVESVLKLPDNNGGNVIINNI